MDFSPRRLKLLLSRVGHVRRVVAEIGEKKSLAARIKAGNNDVVATVLRRRMVRRSFGIRQHVQKGGDILVEYCDRHRLPFCDLKRR